jgi:RHS repeat-associated protein
VTYIHTDHLGGTNVVTNSSGAVAELLDYYPYGSNRLDQQTGFSEQRKFIGQESDPAANLSYLNARYYDGGKAKFMSQDPVFWEVGLTSDGKAAMTNPQAMNSYSYAGGNPIINKDADGRFWWKEFYTDWSGYDVTCVCRDNGLILKAGEVLGGHAEATNAIMLNANNIRNASDQTGVSQQLIKGIMYEELSHQFPPFGIETFDLLPAFRTCPSMISDEGKGKKYVEEQAHGGADDRGAEASGGGTQGGRRGAG